MSAFHCIAFVSTVLCSKDKVFVCFKLFLVSAAFTTACVCCASWQSDLLHLPGTESRLQDASDAGQLCQGCHIGSELLWVCSQSWPALAAAEVDDL